MIKGCCFLLFESLSQFISHACDVVIRIPFHRRCSGIGRWRFVFVKFNQTYRLRRNERASLPEILDLVLGVQLVVLALCYYRLLLLRREGLVNGLYLFRDQRKEPWDGGFLFLNESQFPFSENVGFGKIRAVIQRVDDLFFLGLIKRFEISSPFIREESEEMILTLVNFGSSLLFFGYLQ